MADILVGLMGLVPGQVLAGTSYQVVREIGAGGMGVVYEVEHVRLKKRYVAKIIHEAIRGDETAPVRMEREARVLAEINHPNVVQVHDFGTTPDGTSYFVMEKLEGNDLRHAMKSGALSSARAVSICADVLDALDHVHRRGIVHRDIKPENVFLAEMPNGIVTKVLDFGIVHIFDAERASQARITKTGGFVGTLYYAAPEQMQGNPAGPANDVYACALVLYEMLQGRGPFDDDAGVGLSRCFKPAPRLPPSDRIPSALSEAVASGLDQDPEKRPTAGVLSAMLRRVLTLVPTDPGTVRGDVDRLLGNIDASTAPSPGISLALTASPATPLMAGAPASPRSTAPVSTSFGAVPNAPSALAFAPTLGSPGVVTPPNVDTSPGVASTIDPAPRASRLAIAGALAAAIAVLALIATAGVSALRGRAPASVNATSAVAPPPIDSEKRGADPTSAPAPAQPAMAPSTEASEPVPPADSVARPAAATSAGSPALPTTAPPRPGKGRGNAEKDGYFKPSDL
ncbi:MAG: protein kinase [Labilithrix sp.]